MKFLLKGDKNMAKFEIEGGVPLKGKIRVAGNKNAVLPCMAACVLTDETCVLENVPQILDVVVLGKIMQKLGAKIEGLGTSILTLNCKDIHSFELDPDLVSQLRASILLCGTLLWRSGKVSFRHPGGDVIGRRSIETHISALTSLGAKFRRKVDDYFGEVKRLRGKQVFLDEASVTATENVILAAVLAPGKTIIKNAASEPHVLDLCRFLSKMGAKITGAGSNLLEINGVTRLKGTKHTISPDNIEAGTFAIGAGITGGEIEIVDIEREDLDPILHVLSKMGLKSKFRNRSLFIFPSNLRAVLKVTTGIWPAFPTDLMSCLIVLATQAKGVTLLHDWMYESRMFFVDKLISMGAHVTIADPHRVLVYGPTKLRGQILDTPDLRAGMALILAALAASGKSVIDKIELVERGYEKIEERFSKLGAKIKKRSLS
jgi:UDP-N-acetylglucosamine 1-carboxyvinyltransferase